MCLKCTPHCPSGRQGRAFVGGMLRTGGRAPCPSFFFLFLSQRLSPAFPMRRPAPYYIGTNIHSGEKWVQQCTSAYPAREYISTRRECVFL
ncbi:unnamed protein product, partial [Plutella xylostella]